MHNRYVVRHSTVSLLTLAAAGALSHASVSSFIHWPRPAIPPSRARESTSSARANCYPRLAGASDQELIRISIVNRPVNCRAKVRRDGRLTRCDEKGGVCLVGKWVAERAWNAAASAVVV